MLFFYNIFGLSIASEIELPEASPLPATENPQVTVELGSVNAASFRNNNDKAWRHYSIEPMHTIFGCSAGIFDIRDGSRICIDPVPGAEHSKLRMFLLGSAMGAIQVQRGRIPIHGGAILSGNQGIIISGSPGAGKSTMTSALVHRGFKYLSDDVSSIATENGKPMIIPAYPQLKLIRDACISLGYDPNTLHMVDRERDKFACRNRRDWYGKPVCAGMLVRLISVKAGEPMHAQPVTGRYKLAAVAGSLYRHWMHLREGRLPPEEFKKILSIASAVKIFDVRIPRGDIMENACNLTKILEISP